jgi:hypothetical protein
MGKIYHAFDPAQDGKSELAQEPISRFEIHGASWPQAYWDALIFETEQMISRYRQARQRDGSQFPNPRQTAEARAEMKEQFLKNALKIAQTLERGYVATEDWKPFAEEHQS